MCFVADATFHEFRSVVDGIYDGPHQRQSAVHLPVVVLDVACG
jgi:hypothetical protein